MTAAFTPAMQASTIRSSGARVSFAQTLWLDLRYAVRALRRAPGFTSVALLCLALGVGANASVFSVFNAALLRPLPFQDPDRIADVYAVNPKAGLRHFSVAPADFVDWREQLRSFALVAAYVPWTPTLTGRDQPEQVAAMRASGTLFEVLGAAPLVGRTLTLDDERQEARVAVISHAFWQRTLHGDPTIVGRSLRLNGESYVIVGLMPREFQFPLPGADLWTPLHIAKGRAERGEHSLLVVARLADDVSWAQARAELDALMARLAQQFVVENAGWGAGMTPLRDSVFGAATRRTLWILLGAVGLVLLIACANVANLLLARGSAREQELVIRAALGGSRARLASLLLAESLVLGIAGGALGLLIAAWSRDTLIALLPLGSPLRVNPLVLDWRVIGFTLALSLGSVMLFALMPGWRASRVNLTPSPAAMRVAPLRMRGALLVAQTALAVVLLAGAGLLLRSFLTVWRIDPGFAPQGVLAARVSRPAGPEGGHAEFFQRVLERLSAQPGTVAAAVTWMPLAGEGNSGFISFEGQAPTPEGTVHQSGAHRLIVSPDYFRALGIPLHEGRPFTDTDTQGAPTVVIVNQALARRYWPNTSPIGRRLKRGTPQAKFPWLTVVGVAGDVRQIGLQRAADPTIFLPYLQNPTGTMSLLTRSEASASAGTLATHVRAAVRAVDRDQPIGQVRWLDEVLLTSLAPRWLPLLWMTIFGGLAVVLAAVGVYGVVGYAVSRRSREFGIRVALGADQRDLLRLALRQGLMPAIAGSVIGLAIAAGLTRVLAHLLVEVGPNGDALTFAVAAIVLVTVALLASYPPARRVATQEPTAALRRD